MSIKLCERNIFNFKFFFLNLKFNICNINLYIISILLKNFHLFNLIIVDYIQFYY